MQVSEQQLANIKTNLATLLKRKFAQGNSGEAYVEEVRFDDSKIIVSATIRHHQVWKSPCGKVSTYDVTTPLTIVIDSVTLKLQGSICVDFPPVTGGGRVCLNATDFHASMLLG